MKTDGVAVIGDGEAADDGRGEEEVGRRRRGGCVDKRDDAGLYDHFEF